MFKGQRIGEKIVEKLFFLAAILSVGIVLTISIYMFWAGVPAIWQIGLKDFLLHSAWKPTATPARYGILNMILTSLFGTGGAIILGVPIALLTAIFLVEVAPKWISRLVEPAVELLSGIPSVIYGFWGRKVVVPIVRQAAQQLGFSSSTGASLFSVIIILAIMILPTIVKVTCSALRSLPSSYKEASLALGNTPISTVFAILIPAAKPGILAGVILGVGRAIGETMAVIMVAGNLVEFSNLFSAVRPMTAGIAFEMGYAEGLHRHALFGIGWVLFIFIMIVNVSFTWISKKGVKIDD